MWKNDFLSVIQSDMKIGRRILGKTGVDISMLGLGGKGVLRTYGYDKKAYALINRALDLGVNYYCESARAYSGSEAYYGRALKERRNGIFLTSKSHARDKVEALNHLQQTLKNMKTDHLDLRRFPLFMPLLNFPSELYFLSCPKLVITGRQH